MKLSFSVVICVEVPRAIAVVLAELTNESSSSVCILLDVLLGEDDRMNILVSTITIEITINSSNNEKPSLVFEFFISSYKY